MKISLDKFDMDFLESLKDKEMISFSEKGFYYTILCDDKKAGIVGYIPAKIPEKSGFVQIILGSEFRGRGIVEIAENLLVKECDLEVLFATIQKSNLPSIVSHKKIGFMEIDDLRAAELIKKGLLKESEVRLEKHFK
jgi:RimJ/RimL family protein N-acetyltransferase